jgi:hypothetical protein
MVNLRARWYEPSMMRFNQRDTLRGDQSVGISLNRYLYCGNDPVNFLDPSGKSLSELWEKAKTAVSNGAAAVKKVATAAYNAGRTIVNTAIQKVATVAKPVVNKVVNTVQDIATVAKTQGLVAAAKTLASNVAAVPAYVKNVVSATSAERQAIQAKSAQQITNITQNLGEDLTQIAKVTYGTLSPRNQEIIANAIEEVETLQANGATAAEIARVIAGACTQLAENVGETVAKGVYEAVVPEPIRTDIENFDPNNTSEQVVLDANLFSYYKGKLAIKHEIQGATSAGILNTMFINNTRDIYSPYYADIDTVKHEYGHTQQEEFLGTANYIGSIAIPSLIGYNQNLSFENYYSQPWERSADMFGGLDRTGQNGFSGYNTNSDAEAIEYLVNAKIIGTITQAVASYLFTNILLF